MTDNERQRVLDALLKRATGYRTCESVEEYGADEAGNAVFLKRRETEKDVPGDVSAAKLLLELDGERTDLASLSDEQLKELLKTAVNDVKDLLEDR